MRRTATAVTLTLLGVLAIGGCAQKRVSAVNWQHPTLPQEAWAQDRGECRRYARREMEREAGLPANAPAGDNLSGGLNSYNQRMSSYELGRVQQRAFDSCMRRLGYVPISK
ncbi:MAG: hypothetical protein JJ900_00575 [Rhodospirillales bacterium]|nr:hypothetical protein [Rhodospirillales bacterium]MBO6785311.1 hypothetical protein [Rhodospirillales bacterium]